MSDHKPGTVALIRVSDYPPEIGIRGANGKWYVAGPRLGSQHGWREDRIEIVRPLVVLDLAADEPGHLIQNLLTRANDLDRNDFATHTVAFLRRVADDIKAQTRPPKPAEPTGLGAVVEDAEGERWVRHVGAIAPWHRGDGQPTERPWRYFEDIDAVTVLSEGVA